MDRQKARTKLREREEGNGMKRVGMKRNKEKQKGTKKGDDGKKGNREEK